jgi:uncharacterized DUF497 family protein
MVVKSGDELVARSLHIEGPSLGGSYIPRNIDMSEFEWDIKKAGANLQRHGVSFVEAATVFFDPLSLTVPDPLHSVTEQRFVITGLSNQRRCLVVVHSDRSDKIRIISARLASSSERKKYESTTE